MTTQSRLGRWRLGLGMVIGLAALAAHAATTNLGPAVSVVLARDGRASWPVLAVGSNSSETVRQAARDLAEGLTRLSGAPFVATNSQGPDGILIGAVSNFPGMEVPPILRPENEFDIERYLIQTRTNGLSIIGISDLAVTHGVWDLLHRLGYRQYFPGKTWEIVPRTPLLVAAFNLASAPDYYRRFLTMAAPRHFRYESNVDWLRKNRAYQPGVPSIRRSHNYQNIYNALKPEFDQHPEHLALVGGKRRGQKFCLSNPDLRRMIVQWAVDYLRSHPAELSVSLEPTDGGGWCECEACAAMGSISDRALTMANEAAEAVAKVYPEKFVGMLAYNQHSPPPTLQVHPRVSIGFPQGFIRGGFTADEVMAGWSARGARNCSVGEYTSLFIWHYDLPGATRIFGVRPPWGGYFSKNVRMASLSGGDEWGPVGLRYYLSARTLWDVSEGQRWPEIINEFLDNAFGPAREPVEAFYRAIDGSAAPALSQDFTGMMYGYLNDALARAGGDTAIRTRIGSLVLYVRYVEMMGALRGYGGEAEEDEAKPGAVPAKPAAVEPDEPQDVGKIVSDMETILAAPPEAAIDPAFDPDRDREESRFAPLYALLRHVYRMRMTGMVDAQEIFNNVDCLVQDYRLPPDMRWGVPEGKNPLKNPKLYEEEEILKLLAAGIKANPVIPLDEGVFSQDLAPARGIDIAGLPVGKLGGGTSARQRFYTWADRAPTNLVLTITGGLIAHYRDRGNVRVTVSAMAPNGEAREVALNKDVPPDGQPHDITLSLPEPGLYRLDVHGGGDSCSVKWPEGTPMTLELRNRGTFSGFRWDTTLIFFVPKGTKYVTGIADYPQGRIDDADGRTVHKFARKGRFRVPVMAGQDNRCWTLCNIRWGVVLSSVPPYAACRATELLLPKEVLAAATHQP